MAHITRYGMAIDLNKCVGCGACALACKTENNTEFQQTDGTVTHKYNWADFLTSDEGTFAEGNVKYKVMPVLCNHCTNAPCVDVCPARPEKAMFKTADGITMHNSDRCIGCRFCQAACPYSSRDVNADGVQYSVISYNPEAANTQRFYDNAHTLIPDCTSSPAETADLAGTKPPDKNEYTHPDYNAVRPPNVVEKCIFCQHRLLNGENPYCVDSCPSGARVFGNLDDPQSEISKLLATHGYDRLANNSGDMLGGEPGTDPHVFYIGRFDAGNGQ